MQPTDYPQDQITGLVLAGGQGRRMGGRDKGLLPLDGQAMAAHCLQRLAPQTGAVLINANRNPEIYAEFACPVIHDTLGDYWGPLAGVAAGLARAATPYVLCVPCDAPCFPEDLGLRLYAALRHAGARLSTVHDGTRVQPVFALLHRDLLPDLQDYLASGERRVWQWYQSQGCVQADFSHCPAAFFNANTPEEKAILEQNFTSV